MASDPTANTDLDIDPAEYLRSVEAVWQSHNGEAAAASYTDDAVQIFGNGQQRQGSELRSWPQKWFDFATDLKIKKTLSAFSGDCLAGEWESEYTHPETGRKMVERGAEFFWIRPDGKVYRHHMYEHTWPEGENTDEPWPGA